MGTRGSASLRLDGVLGADGFDRQDVAFFPDEAAPGEITAAESGAVARRSGSGTRLRLNEESARRGRYPPFRRIATKSDWLAVLKECPVSMDDAPPRRRELPRRRIL
jgi:hypothetical protein